MEEGGEGFAEGVLGGGVGGVVEAWRGLVGGYLIRGECVGMFGRDVLEDGRLGALVGGDDRGANDREEEGGGDEGWEGFED